jgi:hypothetical protein
MTLRNSTDKILTANGLHLKNTSIHSVSHWVRCLYWKGGKVALNERKLRAKRAGSTCKDDGFERKTKVLQIIRRMPHDGSEWTV